MLILHQYLRRMTLRLPRITAHFTGSILQWFGSYLSDRHQRVILDGTSSDWLPATSSVPQGSILGPLLFLVYVNDMPNYLQAGSDIALFADDTKLFRPVVSVSSYHSLQLDLECLQKWSLDWDMAFNASKCKVLHISRKKHVNMDYEYDYYLDAQPLEHVQHITDLGIIVSSDLTWKKHIESTCASSNKKLGLIKRVCGWAISDIDTRKLLYCTLVRPKLEYASNVWSPSTVKHRRLVENVQRLATKFLLLIRIDLLS